MHRETDVLIIGAGPFGLSMAADAQARGIEHIVVGKSMDFWKTNMPAGMFLRSACDWHLDAQGTHTIEAYLQTQKLTPADVEPLSLHFYLGYTRWFQEQKGIEPVPVLVQRLDRSEGSDGGFTATLENGDTISANRVVLALGFLSFKHIPPELAQMIPSDRMAHTCDMVHLDELRNKRCLIIGGRQSAYEWAALLCEQGANAAHVSHRHETPAFTEADWSWVTPLVEKMVDNPGWYRNLPQAEKEAVVQRMWGEGRLKLEPWLWPRVDNDTVQMWPQTHVTACNTLPTGELAITLSSGETLTVDQVILATGYKVNIAQVPLLANGNLLARLATRNGYPVLDEHMQSSIPGLFITSMPATQDFGPFFGFTVSVVASTKIMSQAL